MPDKKTCFFTICHSEIADGAVAEGIRLLAVAHPEREGPSFCWKIGLRDERCRRLLLKVFASGGFGWLSYWEVGEGVVLFELVMLVAVLGFGQAHSALEKAGIVLGEDQSQREAA